jgi:hypothetical protein
MTPKSFSFGPIRLDRVLHTPCKRVWDIEPLSKYTYKDTKNPPMMVINGFTSLAGIENMIIDGFKRVL